MQEEGTVQRDRQEGALKLLLGRICCVIGLLLGAGGFVVAILGALLPRVQVGSAPAEKVSQMQDAAPAIERLGVHAYNWWNEGLHGVARSGLATVFPQAVGLASTWDPDLIERVGSAVGDEARAYNEIVEHTSPAIRDDEVVRPRLQHVRQPRHVLRAAAGGWARSCSARA